MDNNWDKQLMSLGGHFLQSNSWLKFQESLGQKLITDQTEDYLWGGYEVDGRMGVKYLYVPYGPTAKKEKDFVRALSSMKAQAKSLGCMFVRFDQVQGFAEDVLENNDCLYFGEVQPRYTHCIDLNDDLSDIKSHMSKTDRNLINRSEKIGVEYGSTKKLDMVDVFLDLMLDTANYKHYQAKSRTYLRKQLMFLLDRGNARIYYGKYDDKFAAGVVGIDWADTRYYIHAGADQEVIRKIPVSRGLAWFMIKDAKNAGLKWFDFYGVSAPGDRHHKWASVSSFKRSFGGQDKDFGGTWDIPVSKFHYRLYRLVKNISRHFQ